jgi:hypothetical protein
MLEHTMIFLGYDLLRQGSWALIEERGKKVYIEDKDCQRAREVINGLSAVSTELPGWQEQILVPEIEEKDGIETIVGVANPWQCQVEYSDQAYQDLLEIADRVVEVAA